MRASAAILVLVIGCKPTAEEELVAGTTGTTGQCEGDAGADGSADGMEGPADAESGSSADAEIPACLYDLAYGPCRKVCQGYEVDGVDCPSFGGAVHFYSVCAFECATVDDCPPTPGGRPAICDQGGCFIECTDSDCPEDSSCVQFGFDAEPTAPWLCMFGA